MAAARKMDELLVSWLGSDAVYESILDLIDQYKKSQDGLDGGIGGGGEGGGAANNPAASGSDDSGDGDTTSSSQASPRGVVLIPPFYPPPSKGDGGGAEYPRRRRRTPPRPYESWDPVEQQQQDQASASGTASTPSTPPRGGGDAGTGTVQPPPPPPPGNEGDPPSAAAAAQQQQEQVCVREQVQLIFGELGQDPPLSSPSSDDASGSVGTPTDPVERLRRQYLTLPNFARVTKDVCRFPSFFNVPLYSRILLLWNTKQQQSEQQQPSAERGEGEEGGESSATTPPASPSSPRNVTTTFAPMEAVTYEILEWFYRTEIEPYDSSDRFFRAVKHPDRDYIVRDDFLPLLSALLQDHPGLEFLSSHGEFQEKYAATVLARIFYSVDTCHSGKITARQLRRSDLLEAFYQVDEEEDINKVTRYLSYEHFYVLYCRFWELDHDRDLRITREDLLKYGDHSLSHMIVDRIFDAAPRPFEGENPNRDYLTYESFIYFMLSEEDKSNEVAVRYWFQCVDVDGDGKLNNMEMRSFYAVQLHRMQCMGQEIVPFEDMLCQMCDMIKPKLSDHFVVEDFLQLECCNVSGALFDALFNLNKYLMFEQRDPFVERQKREDEFECDWDRFACIDYNRLAMEEEAREEEAMEIDWVTVDEEEDAAAAAAAAAAAGGVGGGGAAGGGVANAGGGGDADYGQAGADPIGASVSEAPF